MAGSTEQNEFFERSFSRFPNAVALYTPDGQSVTFGKLLSSIKGVAAKLRAFGVRPGQVIAPTSENPALFYILTLGALRMGATVACVPSVDLATAKGLFADYAINFPDKPSVTTRNLIFDASWFSTEGHDGVGSDGHFIFGSSGTTGQPKYYLARQSVTKGWIDYSSQIFGFNRVDTLVSLPVFSGYGLKLLLHSNLAGGGVFLPHASAAATLRSLKPANPLEMTGTPAFLADLMAAVKAGSPKPPFFRIILGGSPVAMELAAEAEELFGCPVLNSYGSTEAGINSALRVVTEQKIKGTAGKAIPGGAFFVEDDAGRPLPHGEEGHVKVLAPPQNRVLRSLVGSDPLDEQGRFVSGDIGYLLEDGTLVVTGRADERINSSGSKVAPERYEALAQQYVKAREVAAFAIPNAGGSEDVGLALVADEPADRAMLKSKMEEAIGTHLRVHVFQIEMLPRNAAGKVDRQALRKQLVT